MAATSADDEAKLLKIFPNEVWEMIVCEVKDAPNYHRISNASPHFRSLLLPRAPQILFPEVAKSLVPQHVEVLESLPLRQVCRGWRQGMDQRLQTANLLSTGEEEEGLFGYGCQALIGTTFDEEKDFTDFEQHFDPTHHHLAANPFVTRGVDLQIEYNNENGLGLAPLEPFYTACNRVLQKYGHHVWYLTIDLDDMGYPGGLFDFYKRRLPAILQLTPNLRLLAVLCGGFRHLEWESAEQLPFPTTLHQLQWVYMSETPTFLVRELVLRSQQIRGAQAGSSLEILQVYLELLPNLTHLQFRCVVPYDFEAFRKTKVSGRIETLWLDMFDGEVPWKEIFPALKSQFSETLTELRLHLPSIFDKDQENAPELALPNLRRLTLGMRDKAWPLDYLLPLRTLDHLRVELWLDEGADKDTVIKEAKQLEEDGVKLYESWKELKRSSAWIKFPKLQLLQTAVYRRGEEEDTQEECHSCTRDQWEKAQIDRQ